MKNLRFYPFSMLVLVLTFLTGSAFAQNSYKYESVPNDPLNVRIYTLANGLKVYMSVYKDAPRIQTAIAVRTGSKNDPSDNTGLSHYLEHLMFKGTSHFGTIDYEIESAYLQQIENLFEEYRKLTDPDKRRDMYKIIDSISGVAATYAIANEYDKMMSALGVKGTNAYTSVEQTVYINDVPSNQLEKWLKIEFDRFSNPVFRIFHTELETVYEEKNMSLDNDSRKLSEALMSGLYPTHNYGQQTVLGSPEHLKNPSLKSLREYFAARYVPNNMAVVISGDFDPDFAIRKIDETFGKMKSVPLKNYVSPVEKPILKPVVKEVTGPDAENLMLGFRFEGSKSKDADMLTIMDNILSNSNAGLIDINLVKAQKILSGGSYVYSKVDYSSHIFSAKPKKGQSLEDVKELLLLQIDLVKKGEFPEWLIPAIINNLKLSEIREMESNRARNSVMIHSFVHEIPWAEKLKRIEKLSKITKKDIMEFAQNNYNNNYVVVYKRTGPNSAVAKVEKPEITPVKINREAQSAFFTDIVAMPVEPIEPAFLEYEKDIVKVKTDGQVDVNYLYNAENTTFALYYIFDMGTNHNKRLGLALNYLEYLGTSDMTPAQVSEEFYKLACSFRTSVSEDQLYVTLTGLTDNMEKALALFEKVLADAQPNAQALTNLSGDILKKRADDKLSKNVILWSAMYNYGVYGPKNPFTNILSESELKNVKPEELTALIKELKNYKHRILYYGSQKKEELIALLNKYHKTPKSLKDIPAEMPLTEQASDKSKVYVVDYDMKQVEIIMLSKSDRYNSALVPQINVFNEYFGAGMSSIVFQELREAKGLAYTAYGNYRQASRPDRSNFIISFIGTQNDKLPEATAGMYDLLNNMPESEKHFTNARESVVEKIRTERITKSSILFSYERAKRMGLNYDIRKDVFTKAPAITLADVKAFQQKYLKNRNYTILILGKKEKLDTEALKKYGDIVYLSLEDIFGY